MYALQSSHAELRETSEHHSKLLIKILQLLENLRIAESSTGKRIHADNVVGEHGLWPCSICTIGNANAVPFKFDRPSADVVSIEKHFFGTMSKANSAWLAPSKVLSNTNEKKSAASVRIQPPKMKYTNEEERKYELRALKQRREELLFTLQEVERRMDLVCVADLMYRALQEIDGAVAKLEWNSTQNKASF
jgi:hypothetical protein